MNTGDAFQKYETFFVDSLLPSVMNHARQMDVHPMEALVVCIGALAMIAQSQGVQTDELVAVIKEAAPTAHEAPEGLQ